MRKPVTIRDVARVAGVSPATVSFVLNNGPRPVSAATRERVEEVVRELNFRPNAVARGLARRRMNILGVHFCHVESPIVTNFYATGLLAGIFAVAAERNFDVLLLTQPWRNASHSLSALEDGRTDGLLLVAPEENSDILQAVAGLQIPLAAVAAPPEAAALGVLTVSIDNARGMNDAVAHLCGLGHRRIAHITGEILQYDAHARRDAFIAAISRAGLSLPPEYVVEGGFTGEHQDMVASAARCLLTLPQPPTAIVCASDRIAQTAVATAQQMGLSIPEDVSIVGFDDAPVALQTTPLLTTIRQPLFEMGMQSARLLIDRIAGRDIGSTYRLRAPELLVRESTAVAPASAI